MRSSPLDRCAEAGDRSKQCLRVARGEAAPAAVTQGGASVRQSVRAHMKRPLTETVKGATERGSWRASSTSARSTGRPWSLIASTVGK